MVYIHNLYFHFVLETHTNRKKLEVKLTYSESRYRTEQSISIQIMNS